MAKQYNTLTIALQAHFRSKGICLFKSGTYKAHWLQHACLELLGINPRHVWCYSGEDYMSKMKVLMKACLYSRDALSSLRYFTQRYCMALSYNLRNDTWRLKWVEKMMPCSWRIRKQPKPVRNYFFTFPWNLSYGEFLAPKGVVWNDFGLSLSWHSCTMAFLECRERIKVLPSVTVHSLENAIETAFKQVGHRNFKILTATLDGITWKTSASKHVKAYLALFPFLSHIFLICHNGLVPSSDLEKAGNAVFSCILVFFLAFLLWFPAGLEIFSRSPSFRDFRMGHWSLLQLFVFEDPAAGWKTPGNERRFKFVGDVSEKTFHGGIWEDFGSAENHWDWRESQASHCCWKIKALVKGQLWESTCFVEPSETTCFHSCDFGLCGGWRKKTFANFSILTCLCASSFLPIFPQVDFSSLLQGPGGFLDLALDSAFSSAAAALPKSDGMPQHSLPLTPEKPKTKKIKVSKPEVGDCDETWLQHAWDRDEAKALNMSAKCFASRVYHFWDKVSRVRAQKAHQLASQFAKKQRWSVSNIYLGFIQLEHWMWRLFAAYSILMGFRGLGWNSQLGDKQISEATRAISQGGKKQLAFANEESQIGMFQPILCMKKTTCLCNYARTCRFLFGISLIFSAYIVFSYHVSFWKSCTFRACSFWIQVPEPLPLLWFFYALKTLRKTPQLSQSRHCALRRTNAPSLWRQTHFGSNDSC